MIDHEKEGKIFKTIENVNKILNLISSDMFSSLSFLSQATHIHRSSVSRILNENEIFSYKVGHVQELQNDDFEKRIKFYKWYL